MKSGLVRNLRFQLYNVGWMTLYTVGTVVVMMLWMMVSSPLENLAQNWHIQAVCFLFAAAAVWSASFELAMFTQTLPVALSFSTTRRASYWGCQAGKLLYALIVGALGLVVTLLMQQIAPDMVVFGLGASLLLVFFTLIFSSMMELISVLTRRIGKWGVILYAGLCAILGGFVGFFFASNAMDTSTAVNKLLDGLTGSGLLFVCCGVLLVCAVLTSAVSGLLYRKLSV